MNPTPLTFSVRWHALAQRRRGFTLIEVLLALVICSIVLIAINAVFATAVRLRDSTSNAVDETLPIDRTLDVMNRDLKSVVGPGGFLAGDFKCDAQTMGTSMGLSASSGGGLDFFTATGTLSDGAPWGDILEVYYQLKPAADRNQALGFDLVRCVNRNLLATATQGAETQVLLGNVESIQFECFDGIQWRNNWDTSNGDTNLPNAVRIRIQRATDRNLSAVPPQPLEVLVPLSTQTRTNLAQASTLNTQ